MIETLVSYKCRQVTQQVTLLGFHWTCIAGHDQALGHRFDRTNPNCGNLEMASLQQEPTGVFHVVFRINGKRYKRSIGTKSETKANARRDEITETIQLIKRSKINVPDHMSLVEFVLNHGVPTPPPSSLTKCFSLAALFEQFFDSIPDGNIEKETLKMTHIHERHLLRILKPDCEVPKLTGKHLQGYVTARSKERTQYFDNDACYYFFITLNPIKSPF